MTPGPGTGTLRESVERSILAACGTPGELASGQADGTARREAFRQFMVGTLQPLGRVLETEASAKLDGEVCIRWHRLRAADITGRARAFNSLTAKDDKLTKPKRLRRSDSMNDRALTGRTPNTNGSRRS